MRECCDGLDVYMEFAGFFLHSIDDNDAVQNLVQNKIIFFCSIHFVFSAPKIQSKIN